MNIDTAAFKNLKNKYVFFGSILFFLPYDSIRNIMPSFYRPLIVYLMIIYCFYYFFSHKCNIRIGKEILYLGLFCIYAIVSSFILIPLYNTEYSGLIEFILSMGIGIIIYIGCNAGMGNIAKSNTLHHYVSIIFYFINIAYIIPLFVGVMDLFVTLEFLPFSVREGISLIFGGGISGRIAGTSAEPAYFAVHMLFCVPVYFWLYKESRKRRYLLGVFIGTILFLSAFSMHGILVLICGVFLYSLLSFIIDGKWEKFIINFIKAILAMILILTIFMVTVKYFFPEDSYFVSRIINFVDIETMMRTDDSSFERIGYPLISLLMFFDYPIFGVGCGAFSFLFKDYIDNVFPWAMNLTLVYGRYVDNSAPALCLYFRVLAECGIVGGWLFFKMFKLNFRKIRNVKRIRGYKIVLMWISITLMMPIQMSTYAFALFWVVLAFCNNIRKCLDT